jgi:hypothetical protein
MPCGWCTRGLKATFPPVPTLDRRRNWDAEVVKERTYELEFLSHSAYLQLLVTSPPHPAPWSVGPTAGDVLEACSVVVYRTCATSQRHQVVFDLPSPSLGNANSQLVFPADLGLRRLAKCAETALAAQRH